jgi:hypothetical protein
MEKNWPQRKKSRWFFEAVWMTVIGVRNAKSHFIDIGEMSRSRVLTQPVLNNML